MPMDDAALLERWTRRRDTEAFNEIVERFAGQVYVTCRRVLNNDADAEEVAQECFFALARSSGEVRSSLGGWLHRVATFKSRDRIRGDARRRNREHVYGASLVESVEPEWSDIREYVDEAIEALPAELRDAIVAHFLGRKAHAEIAVDLGLTRRAVSYRIERGLEAVRSELRQRGVAVSVAALGISLAAEASAAPFSLKASLGKLAIAAGQSSGAGGATTTGALLGSLSLMKAKLLTVAGIVVVLAAGGYFALMRVPSNESKLSLSSTTEAVSESSEIPGTANGTARSSSKVTPAADAEPPLSDLLALSRGELELALKNYPPIADPAQYASVSGVVLDTNGYPVPDAMIALVPTHNWSKMPRADEITRTGTSGDDGLYRIGDIKREGDFRAVASKQGFTSQAQYAGVKAGKEVTVDFTIQNGLSLQGHVVSASGEAVPNAYVYCLGWTGPRLNMSDLTRASQTDLEGNFTLGFTEEERGLVTALRVQSTKHGAATFPDIPIQSDQIVELQLAAPGVIRGTVKDRSGKPLSDARLTFYAQKTLDIKRDDGEAWSSPAYAGMFIAVSDASGRYATEVDAGMDFQVKVEVHGLDDGSERMDKIAALAAGETREYNAVFVTDSISVRATFVGKQSGQPFTIYVPVEAIAFKDGEKFARSQQDGHFAVRFTLPGKRASYTFQAAYADNSDLTGDMSKSYRLKSGDDIDIELNLPDPQSFSVRVLDQRGQPLESASVKFVMETVGGGPAGYGKTNTEGRLDEPILLAPLCGAQLLVEKPGYAIAQGPDYPDQSPGTVHPEETIVLWPGAGFEGVLLDGEKQPIADAALTISVTNRDGQLWPLQASTDSSGHFTVVNQAPADTVNISITSHNGSGVWSTEQLQLEADAITELGEVTLE